MRRAARPRLPRFLEVRLGVDDFVAIVKKRALYMKRKQYAHDNPAVIRAVHKRWRMKNREYYAEKQRAWREDNRAILSTMSRRSVLKTKYGLTFEQYWRLFAAQDGRCAICHKPPKTVSLSVDHCHRTGQIRGLLCYRCNYGLGHFYSVEALRRAADYFTRGTGLYVPEKRRK
jgi:hypothetical protein